jgi:transcription antitermination factor NusG
MKTGDEVKYTEGSFIHLTGKIKVVKGRKWLTIEWSDGIILTEHIEDLQFI